MKTHNPQESLGVVLDFDGTIVRSMELHAQAYRRALEPHGLHISDQEVFDREGARSETIIGEYLNKVGKNKPDLVREVSDRKQETYRSLGPPQLYPGAAKMVRDLREASPKLGLVTGTRRENLMRLIPDLVPLFDALLAQESYTNDKPHPEPYAKTADALGLPASRCAAVENAPRGVKSARAAGYSFVVGIATTVSKEALRDAGAHVVVVEHEDVTRVIRDWLRKG